MESLIPISRGCKRLGKKGTPGNLIHQAVRIGSIEVGGKALRDGMVKYRSGRHSHWEGIGSSSEEAFRTGLKLIVKAGREFALPTVVEVFHPGDVSLYEDLGKDCLQIGEPNAKNRALLNRMRDTPLPVIHKHGNSLDMEAYLLWVERIRTIGKANVILCERSITSANKYMRNTLDLGGVAAFHYQLSCLPIAVDASHGTGLRDLVHPTTLAGVMAGASVVLVEVHPNPLIAKSDGFQGLFPEQVKHLVTACEEVLETRKRIEPRYVPSALLERDYEDRVAEDKERFFGAR